MKISIYTGVKDGLFYDFHVEAMLRHHLPLADEIVVNEGFSTDGTYEAITAIDPKIVVHRFEWDRSDPSSWHRKFKNQARQLCTGDWCILLDCDEFIPEWEFQRLRAFLETTAESILPVRFVHFYANYKVYMATLPKIVPELGYRIHRNAADIEVWGDGANVSQAGRRQDPTASLAPHAFEVHHFGSVREPSRLRQKWRTQARQHNAQKPRWDRLPSFLFNLFPHKWNDPDVMKDLATYEGPYIQAVRDHPDEFVRDRFAVYEYLKRAGNGDART
jgi:glycosyltransferase involved in cell wall biosynthesis